LNYYTIIIPIYNEFKSLHILLENVKPYAIEGHEIIIIDDGSTDQSPKVLKNLNYINLITFKENKGKGKALRLGLKKSANNKIIIIDGDSEIPFKALSKLMILSEDDGVRCVFGSRYNNLNPLNSLWTFGNYFFTNLFNFAHKSTHKDVLCCAKAFYKNDINWGNLSAVGFSIDVELASILTKSLNEIGTVYLPYKRRDLKQGKKLRIWDGLSILIMIIKCGFINKKD